ncbi:MAG: hypothetical protein J2P41_07915 [Blastocatellia bacterium]|nr:hypothetical protein [Blastocatellia bacterium]
MANKVACVAAAEMLKCNISLSPSSAPGASSSARTGNGYRARRSDDRSTRALVLVVLSLAMLLGLLSLPAYGQVMAAQE